MRLISDFRRVPFLLVFSSVSAGSEEHNSDYGDDVKSSSGSEESTSSSQAFVTLADSPTGESVANSSGWPNFPLCSL